MSAFRPDDVVYRRIDHAEARLGLALCWRDRPLALAVRNLVAFLQEPGDRTDGSPE
jgi:hypothetical protein